MRCKQALTMMSGGDPLMDFLPILVFALGFLIVRMTSRVLAARRESVVNTGS